MRACFILCLCSFDDFIALKNKKNIGDGMDKVIARLAEENESLKGVMLSKSGSYFFYEY